MNEHDTKAGTIYIIVFIILAFLSAIILSVKDAVERKGKYGYCEPQKTKLTEKLNRTENYTAKEQKQI